MINKIYTYWCLFIGLSIYLLIFPIQFVFLQFKSTYFIADRLNYYGIRAMIFFWFFEVNIEGSEYLEKGKNYVIVANHTSYLDVPMLFLINKGFGMFIGKSSLQKIPLFGYMYKKLYILLDRRDVNSRQNVYLKSKQALTDNKNIIIFPEGTFPNKNLPKMLPFKEGAFKIAIETQTPILAVSILNNWKIMPEQKNIRIKKLTFAAKIHKPFYTNNLSLDELNQLRTKVYSIIEKDLIEPENEYN